MTELVEQNARYLVVRINTTEASLNNADMIRQQLAGLLSQHQNNLILELQQVEYADSSFLGALVAVLKQAISIKKEVVLVGLRKDIHNLMSLIRLDKVFKIYPSLPEAVQAIS
ncbi:STAS domain-containing protein [Mucilaginibacter sp.]